MSSTTFFLSTNCFACRAQGYWVVLNMLEDRYVCVAHDDLMTISHLLHGWREQRLGAEPCGQPDGNVAALIETLTSSGIITSTAKQGKEFAEADFPAPRDSIEGSSVNVSTKMLRRCAARFFLACGRIDWRLRTTALLPTLTGVERRRGVRPVGIYGAGHLSRLIGAFKTLRPFYPRPYLCLFESLALFEFLASYRIFPYLIFGVIADPFQAHCWLQDGSRILNDDLERVRRFKPILCL
jgi:hypothetical protein